MKKEAITQIKERIESGMQYANICLQLNISKRTVIRYAKKLGLSRVENGGEWRGRYKHERITAHYYFSKQNAKDKFIFNCF